MVELLNRLALLLLAVSFGIGLASAKIRLEEFDAENVNVMDYKRMTQLRHLSVEFFDYYENITSRDLMLPGGGRLPSAQDLLCLAEIAEFSKGLQSGSMWALKMIDSWGGLPSGILHGNIKDMGNFDECLRITHAISTTGQTLRGKYCPAKLASIGIVSVTTAVCFPASCTDQHVDTLLRRLLQHLLNIEINEQTQLIQDKNCQTAEKEPLDGLTIFTIVLIGILVGFMLLCSIYDYMFCQDQKNLPALVKIFSARVNSRALFRVVDSKANPNVIDCLHGIRCLSFVWVVFGHDYIIAAVSPNINYVDVLPWYRSPFSMFIFHGLFSVDTFFFLSGLLVVMVALRSMEKTKGKMNVALMYLHRYIRLTPVLALAILGYMKLLPIMGEGPIYSGIKTLSSAPCEKSWFWTLLYVQNYVVPDDICLAHSWYLSVDMQLYIISPLLLIALYKWGKKAVAGIVVIMLLLAACLFSMMVIKGYSMNSGNDTDKIYYSTHTRASPWIIGLILGYYLHVNRGKEVKLNRLTVWLGWMMCLAVIFACLFGLYPYQANGYHLPILNEAFYVTLTRIAWPLALVWVVFACKYGYGGMANSFLSSPLWQPLSKLSYCAYIWHLFVEQFNGYITHTDTYFSDYQVMLRFWADFGFTVLVAYLMYILVEAPSGSLMMLLLPSAKPKAKPAAPIEPRDHVEGNVSAPGLEAKTPVID